MARESRERGLEKPAVRRYSAVSWPRAMRVTFSQSCSFSPRYVQPRFPRHASHCHDQRLMKAIILCHVHAHQGIFLRKLRRATK
ncbi:hypothetical protein NDU88_010291 [Pleurodeles waltl]|uniref:Uncharacterized protein n=1 Tax=Pleurodeles waltl TaxID=8319 RepID=A0AAV7PUG8_PLEWA|nr:hypothetical protein NDU88_010291 [Pleurodeles waltl]